MLSVSYAYLLLSLLLCFGFALSLILFPKHSRLAFTCALMTTPFAFTSMLAVPDYWDPPKLGTLLETGIEDVLTTIASCGISLVIAFKIIPSHWIASSSWLKREVITRYLAISFLGLGIGLIAIHIFNLPISIAGISTNIIMAAGLLLIRPFLWPASISGALVFSVFYTLSLVTIYWLSPEFIQTWNEKALMGYAPLGIPCEEFLWAFTTGAVVPVYFGFILSFTPSPRASSGISGA